MNAPPFSTSAPESGPLRERRARLAALGAPLVEWLRCQALPMWSTTGVDRTHGGFVEKIDLAGTPVDEPRRARVVARQIYVFATAQRNGWLPGADFLVDHGLRFLRDRMRLPDGMIASAVAPDGSPVAPQFDLYEHAFVLFALAAAARGRSDRHALQQEAEELLSRMRARWQHARAGFEESNPPTVPLKSNPHMHLLEAALEWLAVAPGSTKAVWQALALELVGLCLDKFIDTNGALHEYFDADWQPLPGDAGRLVEPGHQFEWAWLLMRCDAAGLMPGPAAAAAARLLAIGEAHGVDAARGVAVNAIDQDFQLVDPVAKLWPQTERIKAWHLAAMRSQGPDLAAAQQHLSAAIEGLSRYLLAFPPGLWSEQMAGDGSFPMQDCRASSLYHVVCAIDSVCGRH